MKFEKFHFSRFQSFIFFLELIAIFVGITLLVKKYQWKMEMADRPSTVILKVPEIFKGR